MVVVSVDNRSRGIAFDCEILTRLGNVPHLRASEIFPCRQLIRSQVPVLFVETVPWWAILIPREKIWLLWNHEIRKSYYSMWLASHVLCKTRLAYKLLRHWRWNIETSFVGFTSSSQAEPQLAAPAAGVSGNRFLHLAGQSPYKNTRAVLQTWMSHPQFPPITVVLFGAARRSLDPQFLQAAAVCPNVDLRLSPLEPEEVQHLLRELPFHLCPSSAEGFGHTLNESRLAGAVILTTNSQPMAGYGNLLIDGQRSGFYTRVRPDEVATAVQRAMALSSEERIRLGKQNQLDFLRDHQAFSQRWATLLANRSRLPTQS